MGAPEDSPPCPLSGSTRAAVHSKVLVSFRGISFPSFLGEELGSFLYVEHQVRFELVEHEGFKEGRR